jgi:hypothetical protein
MENIDIYFVGMFAMEVVKNNPLAWHICLSIHLSTFNNSNEFSVISLMGNFTEICLHIPVLIKIR